MLRACAACLIVVCCCPVSTLAADEVEVRSITATSTLEPAKKKYLPGFILDGTLEKSWVEGAKDDGVGERITIELAENVTLGTIQIRNGFGKEKYWAKNNRIKELRISSVQGQQSFTVTLKDTLDAQPIVFPAGWRSNVITFEIRSVYRGTKWRDTAIAELVIPGVATYDTREAQPADVAGEWEHEGEKTSYVFGEGGQCTIYSRDIDPDTDEEVQWQEPCQYEVEGTTVTIRLPDRTLVVVVKKEGAITRLWTADGGFVAQKREDD